MNVKEESWKKVCAWFGNKETTKDKMMITKEDLEEHAHRRRPDDKPECGTNMKIKKTLASYEKLF